MVLLPGCVCCFNCEPPTPEYTSVEIDLTQTGQLTFGVTFEFPPYPGFPAYSDSLQLSLSSLAGTYSLSPYGNIFRYESPSCRLSFIPDALTGFSWLRRQSLQISYRASPTANSVGCNGFDEDLGPASFFPWPGSVSLDCNEQEQSRSYTGVAPAFPQPAGIFCGYYRVGGVGTDEFLEGCRLPVRLVFRMSFIRTFGTQAVFTVQNNTFTETNITTDGVYNFYEFVAAVPVVVSAMRLVYPSGPVDHFVDVGAISCG